MTKQFPSGASVALLLAFTALSVPTLHAARRTRPLPRGLLECPLAVADGQARAFRALCDGRSWSQCPQDTYLSYLHSVSGGGERHIIDVGSNKGYSAATYLSLWSPALNLSPPTLYAFYKGLEDSGEIAQIRNTDDVLCGACNDCKEEVLSYARPGLTAAAATTATTPLTPRRRTRRSGVLHVHSFEASEPNFRLASLGQQHFFPAAAAAAVADTAVTGGAGAAARTGGGIVQWHLTLAAVGRREGVMQWPKDCRSETCSQSSAGGAGTVDVALTSVDAILHRRNLTYVDFLKVDTEGYDANVLRGASRSLAAQRIGMLIFEYHGIGLWQHTVRLKTVVDRLAGYGYVCYMAGRPTLSRMTHCWSDLYERREWSNVLCGTERHFAYMESQSFVGSLTPP